MIFVASVAVIVAMLLGVALFKSRMQLVEAQARARSHEEIAQAKAQEISAQREALKSEFAKLAAELLVNKQRDLTASNAESVRTLFSDLKLKLDKYESELQKSAVSNANMGTEMKTRIDSLQKFADEARAFTAALTGGNKIQGNKGEEILESLFAQSGLREGEQYEMQVGANRDEGRPDACIYDVRNHHQILIDAKMNIKDYISACALPDDAAHRAERERHLKAHAASVRKQIDNLAEKDYANRITSKEGYNNLPLVAMFCPFNAILEAALQQDPAIVQYAYEKKIVLITPLTLWGYLWLVSWGWKQCEVERKYDEIQLLGRDVVTALDALLNDMDALDGALQKARMAYDSLSKRVTGEKGQASVRRVAKKLLDYGVIPKGRLKQLDANSLDLEE
ncbi:MAG: DNA recombination protein RmuC [Kiritimatiellae bacterium]|nr:DNA recombination protein RmuC [Kiritimatiellia bacterium]